jgi:hypothetical protein
MSKHTPLTEAGTERDRRDVANWLIREADQRVKFFPQRVDGVDDVMRATASALLAATADTGLRERVEAITTHNGTPLSPTNLRWAATHEALCRSFIFDVLTGLADALDATAAPTTDAGARDE